MSVRSISPSLARGIAPWALPWVVTACFTGSSASGLPCNADLDCGLHDRCIDGYCGGPPAGGSSDASATGSSSGTSTAATDPTTDGGSCGDGVLDQGEQCEPVTPGLPDMACDVDCTLPVCGDGLTNYEAPSTAIEDAIVNEECDSELMDTPACDANCTASGCGDGYENLAAEHCDDSNSIDLDRCTVACQPTLLATDFGGGVGEWVAIDYDLSYDTPGLTKPGWVLENGRWHSGDIPQITDIQDQYVYSGVTRLISPPMDVPATIDDGFRVELRFAHELALDGCSGTFGLGDGGVVRVAVDGGPIEEAQKLTPVGGYPGTLDNHCAGPEHPPNPQWGRADQQAFTSLEPLAGPVVFDLDMFRGHAIQIVFEYGNDCVQCTFVDEPRGWWIDDVLVAPMPLG
ncbi:MAG: hypothetical protein K1X88_25940 [Nannocystaceae bacterium]|nr:hypothetical protein [Nannocystaceae bacterium]